MGIDPIGGKPFQLKFVRAAQMLLFSNALCDPPLGQTTVIKSDHDVVGLSPSSFLSFLSPCFRLHSRYYWSRASRFLSKIGKLCYGTMAMMIENGEN